MVGRSEGREKEFVQRRSKVDFRPGLTRPIFRSNFSSPLELLSPLSCSTGTLVYDIVNFQFLAYEPLMSL